MANGKLRYRMECGCSYAGGTGTDRLAAVCSAYESGGRVPSWTEVGIGFRVFVAEKARVHGGETGAGMEFGGCSVPASYKAGGYGYDGHAKRLPIRHRGFRRGIACALARNPAVPLSR